MEGRFTADDIESRDPVSQVFNLLSFNENAQLFETSNDITYLKEEIRRLNAELEEARKVAEEHRLTILQTLQKSTLVQMKNDKLEASARQNKDELWNVTCALEQEQATRQEKQTKLAEVTECLGEFGLICEILFIIVNKTVENNGMDEKLKNITDELLRCVDLEREGQTVASDSDTDAGGNMQRSAIKVKLSISKDELASLRNQILSCADNENQGLSSAESAPRILEVINLRQPTPPPYIEYHPANIQLDNPFCPETKISEEVLPEPSSSSQPLPLNLQAPVPTIMIQVEKEAVVRHEAKRKGLGCLCKRKFRTKYDLMRHIQYHSGEKRFQCNLCPEKFAQVVSLNTHIRAVHGIECSLVGCWDCSQTFLDRLEHIQHRKSVHGPGEKLAKKTVHDSPTDIQQNEVEGHEMSVPKPKKAGKSCHGVAKGENLKCRCGMQFKITSRLTRHIRYHTNTSEPKFVCKICQNAYYTTYGLRRHLLTHGIKYTGKNGCRACGKTFSSFQNLLAHRKSVHYSMRLVKKRNYLSADTLERKKVKFILPRPPSLPSKKQGESSAE